MRKTLGMAVLLAALCVAIYLKSDTFIGTTNLQNLSRQIALLAVFAIGEGIVILSGGIDLSVGSVIAFTGLFVAYAVNEFGMSPWTASLIVLGICVVIGLAHGALITRLKLQPFIVTLCSMLILRGLARGLTEDETMGFGERFPGFRLLGNGDWLGIPAPVVILIVVGIIAHFFMRYTVYGRYLYAIGRNPDAARYSGVKVDRMQTGAYLACAVLAGIAGILHASYTNSVQPATTGQAYELYAIAAAVLGGCSMRGGEGTVLGIIIGASIMRVMYNGIILVGIPTFYEFAVIGLVILIGVVADASVKSRGTRVAKRPTRT
ncbi:MAG: ABC transporter permease [Armatimonadetes bacterium]|nr:ABC transporter permease [Armatimonadota bacterium]